MNKHRPLYRNGVGEPSSKYGYHNQHMLDQDLKETQIKKENVKSDTKIYMSKLVKRYKLLPDTVWNAVIEALTEIRDDYI